MTYAGIMEPFSSSGICGLGVGYRGRTVLLDTARGHVVAEGVGCELRRGGVGGVVGVACLP